MRASLRHHRIRLSDALTLLTTVGAILAVALSWGRLADPVTELAMHGVALALLVGAIRVGRTGTERRSNLVRVPAYLIWMYVFHRSAGVFIDELGLPTWERELSALDHLLFGGDLSVILQALYSPTLTEVIQIVYASFYIVLFALPVSLALTGRQPELHLVLALWVMAHTVLVIGNVAFAARWPALLYQDPRVADVIVYPFEMEGLWLTAGLRDGIANGTRMFWDSMPSGHTCISLVMTVSAARAMPRLLWLMAPLATGILFATVYLRYHYGVDVLAGAALAALVLWRGPAISAAWDRTFTTPP